MNALLHKLIGEELSRRLQETLPGVDLNPTLTPGTEDCEEVLTIDLPPAGDADYAFQLCLLPERQIHALPLSPDLHDAYFWYLPFEPEAYRGREQALDEDFLANLALLARHETRIVQHHGLACEDFKCEYLENELWKTLFCVSCFRPGGFRVPHIEGRKHTYRSPALIL